MPNELRKSSLLIVSLVAHLRRVHGGAELRFMILTHLSSRRNSRVVMRTQSSARQAQVLVVLPSLATLVSTRSGEVQLVTGEPSAMLSKRFSLKLFILLLRLPAVLYGQRTLAHILGISLTWTSKSKAHYLQMAVAFRTRAPIAPIRSYLRGVRATRWSCSSNRKCSRHPGAACLQSIPFIRWRQ